MRSDQAQSDRAQSDRALSDQVGPAGSGRHGEVGPAGVGRHGEIGPARARVGPRGPERRQRSGGRRGDVQGLRAVAVLLVVLSHAGIGGLAGGYVGVDVFFVISGFLITGILVRELTRTAHVSIADFYARRARRILPAATVVLLSVVAVSSLLLTSARLGEVKTQVTWAAFFAANVYSSRSGSDYFAEGAFVSPVQHFWSLAVEEQFYLGWPLLIALLLSTAGGQPARRRTVLALRRLTLVTAALCGLSLAWSAWRTSAAPTAAYYSTLTRGWELGAGSLLALCTGSVARWPAATKLVASWAGLVAIATAAVRFSPETAFPGYHAALPVLGAVLVLAGGVDGPAYGARVVLDTRPMRWFGDVSYSLYLWHWPFLVLPELYVARRLTLPERLVLLVAATLAAALSYRLVELPTRRSALLSQVRVTSLMLWPTAAALVVAAVIYGGSEAVDHSPAAASTVALGASPTVPAGVDPAVYAVRAATAAARAHQPLPENLRPALADLDADVSRAPAGCKAERDDLAVSSCVLGDRAGGRTMVLFGDSHALMWLRPLERLAKAHGWRIVPVEKASCFPLDATLWRGDRQRAYTECDTWRRAAYREMARIRPDRIVVSGLVAPTAVDPATGRLAVASVDRRLFAAGVRSTLARLRELSPRVLVIGGTPTLEKPAGDCLGTRKATMATCTRPPGVLLAQRNRQWKAAATATGAEFVDPLPWFCDQLCPVVVGGVVVYRDTNHITRTFADTLAAQLGRALALS